MIISITNHISGANRPARGNFSCVCCGFSGQADAIGATNIAQKAAVNLPIMARFFAEPQALQYGGEHAR